MTTTDDYKAYMHKTEREKREGRDKRKLGIKIDHGHILWTAEKKSDTHTPQIVYINMHKMEIFMVAWDRVAILLLLTFMLQA